MKLLRAHPRWISLVAAVLCAASAIAVAQQGAPAGAQTRELRHARLYVVASSQVFNKVNRDDARVALKVWFTVLAQQRGFLLDSKVDILDSVAEIKERLDRFAKLRKQRSGG